MTEWAQSTLRVRNAELFTNEEGDWVRAEFDTDAITEFVIPMVMPQLITEAIQNEDFVRNLADMLSPQVTMRWTADLMEHMTPEELSAVLARFLPPDPGPLSD